MIWIKSFNPTSFHTTFTNVILPPDRITADETNQWLILGFAGVDGIEFRTPIDEASWDIFAYYPIEIDHLKIADSAEDLVMKWKNNQIIL